MSLPARSPHLNHRRLHLPNLPPYLNHSHLEQPSTSPHLRRLSSTMAMIYQLLRENGQPLPYFVIEPLNNEPHRSACLTLGYVYPCSAHCHSLSVPWQTAQAGGNATAVAPMIQLDLVQQFAQDVSYPTQHERKCWPRADALAR